MPLLLCGGVVVGVIAQGPAPAHPPLMVLTHMYIYTYTYVHTHIYIHICMYIHMYIHILITGTLDVSLLYVHNGFVTVEGVDGDDHLGGRCVSGVLCFVGEGCNGDSWVD